MTHSFKYLLCPLLIGLMLTSNSFGTMNIKQGAIAEAKKKEILNLKNMWDGVGQDNLGAGFDLMATLDPKLEFIPEEVKIAAKILMMKNAMNGLYKPLVAYFENLPSTEKIKMIQDAPYKAVYQTNPVWALYLIFAKYLKDKNNETFDENASFDVLQKYVDAQIKK